MRSWAGGISSVRASAACQQLDNLTASNLKTGRAYRIRLAFQELYLQPARNAEAFLKKWYWRATHSRLPPMIEAARMVKRHWDGILRWFH